MPNKIKNIAILGGTEQVGEIIKKYAKHNITLCLAGRTKQPQKKYNNIKTRIGGFGGDKGLKTWLLENNIHCLIDATHPFATQISQNAILATKHIATELKIITRSPWQKQKNDNWQQVKNIKQAINSLPKNATVFLALGHQHIKTFAKRDDVNFVTRQIDPPKEKIKQWQYIIAPPSANEKQEMALFEKYKISHLVCRNSGSKTSYGKIIAARKLKIKVIIIDQPA